MAAISWVILIESLALAVVIGWSVVREILHARTMALVNAELDDLQCEIDRLQGRLEVEVS